MYFTQITVIESMYLFSKMQAFDTSIFEKLEANYFVE